MSLRNNESREIEELREKLKTSIEVFCNCLPSKKAVEAYKVFNSSASKAEASKLLEAMIEPLAWNRKPGINLDNILDLRERLQ